MTPMQYKLSIAALGQTKLNFSVLPDNNMYLMSEKVGFAYVHFKNKTESFREMLPMLQVSLQTCNQLLSSFQSTGSLVCPV